MTTATAARFTARVDTDDRKRAVLAERVDRIAAEAAATDALEAHLAATGHTASPAQLFPGASFYYCAGCKHVTTVGKA